MYTVKLGVFGVLAFQTTNGVALSGPKAWGFCLFFGVLGVIIGAFWGLIGKINLFQAKNPGI
jgi:hypothetical protein